MSCPTLQNLLSRYIQKGLSYSPAGPLRPPRFFLSSAMMCWIAHVQQRPEFSVENQSVSVSTMSSRSEEHTSELQSLMRISYPVFCLQKKHTTKIAIEIVRTPITNYNIISRFM